MSQAEPESIRRGSIPRALGIFCGTIAFLVTILLGLLAGEKLGVAIFRAVVAGLALGVFASLLGALGTLVVREALSRPVRRDGLESPVPDPAPAEGPVQEDQESESGALARAGPPGKTGPPREAPQAANSSSS